MVAISSVEADGDGDGDGDDSGNGSGNGSGSGEWVTEAAGRSEVGAGRR
ncbi:hypothetical protein Aca07nite_75530 [Actinoplanes capillaceus]|uniref:Uncharacterized protein n=1 Tax=Actinoplanes campanulatus TaxID=113559 RepID=A0ABQ3WVF6_9ACTN|nr:hypothetical protein Aca07nite_75530 [Actinoplanes capillaceus]